MDDSLLLGVWRYLVPIPRAIWQRHVGSDVDLGFMTDAHHRVRNYVVREMPKVGGPLSPERIAEELSHIVFDTHSGKNDSKFRIHPLDPRLSGNLSGQVIVRKSVTGKNGKLLTPDKGIHAVNNRNSGLYEIAGILSCGGIDRHSIDIEFNVARLRGPPVNWTPQAIKYASEHFL